MTPDLSVGGVLETIFGGLIGLDGPYTFDGRSSAISSRLRCSRWGSRAIILLGFLLLPLDHAARAGPDEDRERADALVHAYGSDTLAYFALRDDKSFFFASDGEAMIAYTYLGGYALVSGDPIGAPESIPLVIDEFVDFCHERGWKVAFLAVREADVPLYEARGMRSIYLGDEAIIRCDRFDSTARA